MSIIFLAYLYFLYIKIFIKCLVKTRLRCNKCDDAGLGDLPGLVTRSRHHCSLSQWPHAISHRWGQSSPSPSSPSPVSTAAVTWGVKHEVLSVPSASLDVDNEVSHAGSCLCLRVVMGSGPGPGRTQDTGMLSVGDQPPPSPHTHSQTDTRAESRCRVSSVKESCLVSSEYRKDVLLSSCPGSSWSDKLALGNKKPPM